MPVFVLLFIFRVCHTYINIAVVTRSSQNDAFRIHTNRNLNRNLDQYTTANKLDSRTEMKHRNCDWYPETPAYCAPRGISRVPSKMKQQRRTTNDDDDDDDDGVFRETPPSTHGKSRDEAVDLRLRRRRLKRRTPIAPITDNPDCLLSGRRERRIWSRRRDYIIEQGRRLCNAGCEERGVLAFHRGGSAISHPV
jgi:hypothetical protein